MILKRALKNDNWGTFCLNSVKITPFFFQILERRKFAAYYRRGDHIRFCFFLKEVLCRLKELSVRLVEV